VVLSSVPLPCLSFSQRQWRKPNAACNRLGLAYLHSMDIIHGDLRGVSKQFDVNATVLIFFAGECPNFSKSRRQTIRLQTLQTSGKRMLCSCQVEGLV
jgi:hypothetical protein